MNSNSFLTRFLCETTGCPKKCIDWNTACFEVYRNSPHIHTILKTLSCSPIHSKWKNVKDEILIFSWKTLRKEKFFGKYKISEKTIAQIVLEICQVLEKLWRNFFSVALFITSLVFSVIVTEAEKLQKWIGQSF